MADEHIARTGYPAVTDPAAPHRTCPYCRNWMETLESETQGLLYACWQPECAFEDVILAAVNLDRIEAWIPVLTG